MASIRLGKSSRYTDTKLLQDEDRLYFDLWDDPLELEPNSVTDIAYTIQVSDTLDKLAKRFYGDERLWWIIAERNGIIHAIDECVPGHDIIIPNPEEVTEQWTKT